VFEAVFAGISDAAIVNVIFGCFTAVLIYCPLNANVIGAGDAGHQLLRPKLELQTSFTHKLCVTCSPCPAFSQHVEIICRILQNKLSVRPPDEYVTQIEGWGGDERSVEE
jgi:hypothetical protein